MDNIGLVVGKSDIADGPGYGGTVHFSRILTVQATVFPRIVVMPTGRLHTKEVGRAVWHETRRAPLTVIAMTVKTPASVGNE